MYACLFIPLRHKHTPVWMGDVNTEKKIYTDRT